MWKDVAFQDENTWAIKVPQQYNQPSAIIGSVVINKHHVKKATWTLQSHDTTD